MAYFELQRTGAQHQALDKLNYTGMKLEEKGEKSK